MCTQKKLEWDSLVCLARKGHRDRRWVQRSFEGSISYLRHFFSFLLFQTDKGSYPRTEEATVLLYGENPPPRPRPALQTSIAPFFPEVTKSKSQTHHESLGLKGILLWVGNRFLQGWVCF